MSKNKPENPDIPTAIIIENNELREQIHASSKKFGFSNIKILVASLLMNVLLIWVAFFYFPTTKYLPSANAAAVCNIVPMDQPFIHHQVVADFAVEAAISVYTYDYVNYKRSIGTTTDKYFTPEYRDAFMLSFGNSANLKTVIDNYYVVSATTAGRPPQIVENGKRGGVFYWKVQVPLDVYYVSGRKNQVEKILATIEVTRTQPSRLNPRAIAVREIVTAPFIR